nr:hypothetical protein [uncultured Acetatifactor sp.]
MRYEMYTRELIEDGYRVVGSSTYDIEPYDFASYDSIKMTSCRVHFDCSISQDESVCNNFGALIEFAETNHGDDSEDFEENYAEIMRGNRPDWHLGGFEVFVDGITLFFGNHVNGDVGWVYITGARHLQLAFECSRTRLGFDPKYDIYIEHFLEREPITRVEEDLGYIYRRIDFKLKDPNRKDNICHEGNQYIEITEYAGM